MTFGLTGGEITLVIVIFALIYAAGLLPKLARRLSPGAAPDKRDTPTDD